MTSLIVNSSDAKLHCEWFGDHEHPVVLLISGAGAPGAFWHQTLIEALDIAGYSVVRFDHRDTGHSTHFDEPYNISVLVNDVLALMDYLNNQSIHLIGHSMGGYIAQLAVRQAANKVSSVTSISAGCAIDPVIMEKLGMSSPSPDVWDILLQNTPVGDFDVDLPGWLKSWKFLNGQCSYDEDMAMQYTFALYQGDKRNAQIADTHIYAMNTVPARLS